MRYISSGHSHGKQITIILEGIPSNLELNRDLINLELAKRQSGYGRGERMKIENDKVEITGGVLFSMTTGAPITLIINNKDYENHKHYMDPFVVDEKYQKIVVPRPGHADLAGAIKYSVRDMRIVAERASARETVSRVVVGAICKQILNKLGISSRSYVSNIGGIESLEYSDYVLESSVRMSSSVSTQLAEKKIDEARLKKDTIGGIAVTEVFNVPIGLGSFVTSESKLDGRIAGSVLSIQSCKGVMFGDGFNLASEYGSAVHDEIIYDNGYLRNSNHYGGFEGGMTTGMPIKVTAVFKPIPTLMQPLISVNIDTKEGVLSHIERSDVCAVPAASVIMENTVVFEVTKAILDQFTSDSMDQLIKEVNRYREYTKEF